MIHLWLLTALSNAGDVEPPVVETPRGGAGAPSRRRQEFFVTEYAPEPVKPERIEPKAKPQDDLAAELILLMAA